MTFEAFVEQVRTSILDHLPERYQDAAIEIAPHEKINQRYLGLTVRTRDERVCPTLNLDHFYAMSHGDSAGMEEIFSRMTDIIQMEPVRFDIRTLTDYEEARKNLFIRVCDPDRNQDLLAQVPHARREGLAVTYHILVQKNAEGISSAIVSDEMMDAFGITWEQLHQDALENSPKVFPPVIERVDTVLMQMERQEMEAAGMDEDDIEQLLGMMRPAIPMTVVTNKEKINGAAVLFYPGIMEQIGENMEGGYYILPSSIHEFLIVPEQDGMGAVEMQEMIRDVNQSMVLPELQLADEAYHYDPETHLFEKAFTYEERRKEQELARREELSLHGPEQRQKEKDMGFRL